ncbi:MAG: hypothetical protein WDO73_29085 [Ignavibacteriota bacterium]
MLTIPMSAIIAWLGVLGAAAGGWGIEPPHRPQLLASFDYAQPPTISEWKGFHRIR